jgi:hypothetical protein
MHEYESFVYLDVQKTGSSFISSVLKKYCSERLIRKIPHKPVDERVCETKFCFISIRNPLDQYISLYSFGAQAAGKMFRGLNKKGYGDLYDGTWGGFKAWLGFVLRPENSHLLGDRAYVATGGVSDLIGIQSFRVLALAIPRSLDILKLCRTREDISDAYRVNNIVSFTVRQESLRKDLATLLTTKLRNSITNLDEALRFVNAAEPRNQSDRVDRYEEDPQLNDRLRRLLREREWALYQLFGY